MDKYSNQKFIPFIWMCEIWWTWVSHKISYLSSNMLFSIHSIVDKALKNMLVYCKHTHVRVGGVHGCVYRHKWLLKESKCIHLYVFILDYANICGSRHLYMNVYIYIYIYIYILSSTDRLFPCITSLQWLDTQDTSSWDRNQPNLTLDMVSNRLAISAS